MRVLIDTGDYKPQNNDIIVFKDGKWVIIQASMFLKEQDNRLFEQDNKLHAQDVRIAEQDALIDDFISQTNAKINAMAKSIKTLLGE